MEATYILPIRHGKVDEDLDELTEYLSWLSGQLEVIVVDGSSPDIFAIHRAYWRHFGSHIRPDADIQAINGKVRGVLTGLRRASFEHVVIADEDVRYDEQSLTRLTDLLEQFDVIRPQNYFDPLPWHACWDTGRTLLNRMTGGDWPGTLGVNASLLKATNGYDGNVLFENLELVRTIRAAGGKELVALDLFVLRKPATDHHFWLQRVRQAYDEFARPVRLLVSLTILPSVLSLILRHKWVALMSSVFAVMCIAEMGRRRDGGQRVFPFAASLLAPAWVMERAICIWLALGTRVFSGGVSYHGTILSRAATPERVLLHRYMERARRDPEKPLPTS